MFVFRVVRAVLRLPRRNRQVGTSCRAVPPNVDSPSLRIPATPHCVRYDFYLPAGSAHYHRGSAGELHAYEGPDCPGLAAADQHNPAA